MHKLGVNPALTQARTKRRVKIASLLENMDEDVDYEKEEGAGAYVYAIKITPKSAPTGIDLTPSLEGRAGEGLKLLRDGQLIILRNGLEYTPDGKLTTRTHSTTKN